MLVHRGEASIPALLETLKSPNAQKRWEVVRALGDIQTPAAPPAPCNTLLDKEFSVRWAATEGLVKSGRESLRPMLELFLKEFDSVWLREGVHHVLRVLKDRHQLRPPEIKLFEALDQHNIFGFEVGWTSEAGWAAEKALEALNRDLT